MSKGNEVVYKPRIPTDILDTFLIDKIKDEDKKKIVKVSDHFLWKGNDVDRYRINVWMQESIEGYYCNRNYIGYSWFVHYYTATKTIIDKTL